MLPLALLLQKFYARQLWLVFIDAVGIALQVMEDVKERAADWFKAWVKGFRTPRTIKKPVQLSIDFLQIRKISDWADLRPKKNRELFG